MAELTCAACGEKKQLCRSVIIDGVQQARICKDCLIRNMESPDEVTIDAEYWMQQRMEEQNDEHGNR